jgi:hypothetical protein
MNSFNQSNFNELDNNYINLNKSEKFQDAVDKMRLMMWSRFLSGIANNPNMTKKEICHHLGLKVGTINSIQQHYKLQSPFYFKKPKTYKKKENSGRNLELRENLNINDKTTPPSTLKIKINKSLKAGGSTSNFEETFNKSVENLKI